MAVLDRRQRTIEISVIKLLCGQMVNYFLTKFCGIVGEKSNK